VGRAKTWDIYMCDKDYYPEELKNIALEGRTKQIQN
jgi:hypothetical protein